MPRIKPKRSTPRLDMTPMVDLAFLLVTFFMLTTKFRPEEPVPVDIPASESKMTLPDLHIMTLTVSTDGRVFLDVQQKGIRQAWAQKLSEQFKLNLNDDEVNTFSNLSSFGVPMEQLKSYLDLSGPERKAFKQPGVPIDSAHNELGNYILYARLAAENNLNIAIKGDRDADYKTVKEVIKIVQEAPNNINNFNLITTLAAGPPK